jgi:hypothetical protein
VAKGATGSREEVEKELCFVCGDKADHISATEAKGVCCTCWGDC